VRSYVCQGQIPSQHSLYSSNECLCGRACDRCFLHVQGLERWESSSAAYTQAYEQLALGKSSHGLPAYIPALLAARRGLLVVGELPRAEDAVAAVRLATALGWPIVCDVLSGGSCVFV